jgi:hypothetical protein
VGSDEKETEKKKRLFKIGSYAFYYRNAAMKVFTGFLYGSRAVWALRMHRYSVCRIRNRALGRQFVTPNKGPVT